MRIVIGSDLHIAGQQIPVELTLTERDAMRLRMLPGWIELQNTRIVGPAPSCVRGRYRRPGGKR
jgi:hypothetical protein